MTADYNGWADMPEEEREWEIPEELPFGPPDPWEGWPEELCGPEYWLNMRDLEG